MPNFDKTGPKGKGPKTGRGLGDCNSVKQKTSNNFSNEQLKTKKNPRVNRPRRQQGR